MAKQAFEHYEGMHLAARASFANALRESIKVVLDYVIHLLALEACTSYSRSMEVLQHS